MFNIDDRVEVIDYAPDWDSSIYTGLKGTVVPQPNGALPYETDWPWVALDRVPKGLPVDHDKIMMFNPKSLRKL